jgi:hypothetical protein
LLLVVTPPPDPPPSEVNGYGETLDLVPILSNPGNRTEVVVSVLLGFLNRSSGEAYGQKAGPFILKYSEAIAVTVQI